MTLFHLKYFECFLKIQLALKRLSVTGLAAPKHWNQFLMKNKIYKPTTAVAITGYQPYFTKLVAVSI